MNRHALNRLPLTPAWLLATVLAPLMIAPASAEQFGAFEVAGFAKDEFSGCDNCSLGLVNPSTYDPRGVLRQASAQSPNAPLVNQGGPSGKRGSNLALAMLTLGAKHEFDNAVGVEARVSGRWRNGDADIFGQYVIDGYVGASYPRYGAIQAGIISSRSWTRSDSFAYPIGLSSAWAESGAGYSVLKRAVRFTSRQFEIPIGKLTLEATYATAPVAYPLNPSSSVNAPPHPRLYELFAQYSNEKNLIEAVFQSSSGGLQNSFSKGAFTGSIGNTDIGNAKLGGGAPSENVTIIEGTYYRNERWRLTYGLKRNEWSGLQQQCDYSKAKQTCYWDQPGFNYASDGRQHHAIEYDGLLGVGYVKRLWVFTIGTVRMNKAYTQTPTEWGQSNSATFVNLGIYRKLPEVYKHLEVYGGIGRVIFGRQGPAPLSMPGNTAFGNVDPRTSESGNSVTLGMNLIF